MKKLLALFALWIGMSGAAFALDVKSIVLNPPVTGSALSGNTGTIQLTPVCTYTDNTSDNCAGVVLTWASVGSIATVNSSGLVTISGSGSYAASSILAYVASAAPSAQNGYVYGLREVRANYTPSTLAITVGFTTGFGSSHIVVGSTGELTAFDNFTAPFYQGSAQAAVAWTSGSPSIATVNNYGEVTGVSTGDAVITAKILGLTANYTIHVLSPTLDLNTYYVRSGGSDANCTGLANVDYPGSGSGVACAWATSDHAASTAGSGSTTYIIGGPYTLTSGPQPASGTAAHLTKFYGACMLTANCSTDPYNAGNRTVLYAGSNSLSVVERQFLDFEGIDLSPGPGWECSAVSPSWFPNPCPGGTKTRGVFFDQLSGQNKFRYMRIHGYMDGTTGTQGPGNQWIDSALVQNYHTGFNADDAFGTGGVIADGNSFTNVTVDTSGYVDMQPRTISALSRGSGNLNVTFAAGSVTKYFPGSNIVIQGASPSDLNGTYPVTSVNFNQQSATITGGTIATQAEAGGTFWLATVNTSAAVTFAQGAFVKISGATPSFLNGYWAVSSVSGSSFTFNVSGGAHPTWTSGTISSGGTAATSLSLVATAAGSSETATTPGTATFVRPATLGCDQGTAAYCNGDAWGGGFNTSGIWSFINTSCSFNLQDCHDNLHGNIVSDTIDGFYSNGNEGAAIKVGLANTITVKNAVIGANCAANLAPLNPDFPGDYNQFVAMPCRANDAAVVQTQPYGSYVFSNNSMENAQQVAIDDTCSAGDCSSPYPMAQYIMQNWLFEGFIDTNSPVWSGAQPTIYFSESGASSALWSWNNNMATNMRNPPTGGANNQWTTDPLVTQAVPNIASLAAEINSVTWNLRPTAPSPALLAGLHNAYTPALDYSGATRPNPPSMGAYELVGAPTAPTPTFSPVGGAYPFPFNMTITDAVGGLTICQNTTGSPATNGGSGCTAGTLYTTPIAINSAQTRYAVAGNADYLDSPVGSVTYTQAQAATPVSTPANGYSGVATTLTYTCSTPSSTIFYTTGGGAPGTLYTGGISVTTTSTYRALCRASGYTDSAISSTTLTITIPQAANPVSSPPAPTYTGPATTLTYTCSTPSSSIYYTTGGGAPTTLYTVGIPVSVNSTYRALCRASGYTDSAIVSTALTITAGSNVTITGMVTVTGTGSVQ